MSGREAPTMGMRAAHLAIVLALAIVVYANAFNAPFHFDDFDYIVNNPLIQGAELDPLVAERFGLYHVYETRIVGFRSFALTFEIFRLNVHGYHLGNLLIHAGAGWMAYLLASLIYARAGLGWRWGAWAALFAAALFTVHPVQTQAVTYISQRFASLAALFYMLALASYVKARGAGGWRVWPYYLVALAATALAMKTKESAFTLPLAMAVYEWGFHRGEAWGRRMGMLAAPMLMMLIVPLGVMRGGDGSLVASVIEATRTQTELSHAEYLATTPRVVLTYLRLMLLPVGQNLDYDYPISGMPEGLAGGALLLGMAALCIYAYARASGGGGRHPAAHAASFGALLFLLGHLVEGSAALADVIFEHRMYMPMAGASIALGAVSHWAWGRWPGMRPVAAAAMVALVVLMGLLAYERNKVWRDGVTLWQDVAWKAPMKGRALANLAIAYGREGMMDRALREIERAARVAPGDVTVLMLAGRMYLDAGGTVRSVQYLERAAALEPDNPEVLYALGLAWMRAEEHAEAEALVMRAIAIRGAFPEALITMGELRRMQGRVEEAGEYLKRAVSLAPQSQEARRALALHLLGAGETGQAGVQLGYLLKLNPMDQEARGLLREMEEGAGPRQ